MRDPFAGVDFERYLSMVENKDSLTYILKDSPSFWYLARFLNDNLNIGGVNALHIISSLPVLLIALTSLLFSSPYSIIGYISSESFTLLSFNGIRQGISEGFLIIAIGLFVYQGVNLKNLKITKVILPLLLMAISFGSHFAAFAYTILAVFSYLFKAIIKIILKFKLKYNFFIPLSLVVSIFLLFLFQKDQLDFLQWDRISGFSLNDFSINSSNPKFIIFSSYRFILMLIFTIYFYINSNLDYKTNKKVSYLRTIVLHLNLAFIPILPFLFISPLIVSRFSHFCIIPIYFSLLGINEVRNNPPQSLRFVIIAMGLIAYSSYAVRSNLININ